MAEMDKARLEKRRDEILEQLSQVNEDLQTPLDNDLEEQAIEIEQEEVAIAQERNLRKELTAIEEQLNGE
jgi:RNA polymerase-binding transcription factor DksA